MKAKTRAHEGVVRGLGADAEGTVLLDDGAVVLARGVLPGERVRVEEIGRSAVRRASHVEVLRASPDRVAPPCAFVDRCGGCPLMHASASLAAETKRERVLRALLPLEAELSIAVDTPVQQLGYRRRARLAFVREADGITIGYRAEGSRNVVDVDRCVVLAPVLAEGLAILRTRLAPHLVGSGELRLGAAGERGTVRIESRDPQPSALYAEVDRIVREGALAGVALAVAGAGATVFGVAHEEMRDAEGRVLRAPLGGFGQAHAEHNRALAAHAIEEAAVDGARVLELFAGHGNFSLSLAARAESLITVELEGEAARCLRENLEAHGLSATVRTGDAATVTHAIARGTIDVVLLDPPRDGARDVMAPLVALGASRIVYVSCRPESLARDGAMLVAGGYKLVSARAVDMFPQTAHVEVVAKFERAGVAARPSRR